VLLSYVYIHLALSELVLFFWLSEFWPFGFWSYVIGPLDFCPFGLMSFWCLFFWPFGFWPFWVLVLCHIPLLITIYIVSRVVGLRVEGTFNVRRDRQLT